MRLLAGLLSALVISWLLTNEQGLVARPTPQSLIVGAALASIAALYISRNKHFSSLFRPSDHPHIFVEMYQDFDRSTWHAVLHVICSPRTKVLINELFLPDGTEKEIGLQSMQAGRSQVSGEEQKRLIVNERLKPGHIVGLSISAERLSEASGKAFVSYEWSGLGCGGGGSVEIPIGVNWEDNFSFQTKQQGELVAALKKLGYPPF